MNDSYTYWKKIAENFIKHCADNGKPNYGETSFREEEGTINVFVVRRNAEISFNDSDKFYNDDAYIVENRPNDSFRLYSYRVTADPANRKYKMAHLCEGAYNSYVIRNHRFIPGRTALCQDADEVKVMRTDTNGYFMNYDRGFFGINFHDKNGWGNSINTSLGCIILYSQDYYVNEFKPLLERIKSLGVQKRITIYLINEKTFNSIQP